MFRTMSNLFRGDAESGIRVELRVLKGSDVSGVEFRKDGFENSFGNEGCWGERYAGPFKRAMQ